MSIFRGGFSIRGRAGGTPTVSNYLLEYINSTYSGGHFKCYSTLTGAPHPESDTLLINKTIPTPAVGSVVSLTEIILATITGAIVLAGSLSTKPKYGVLTTSSNTNPILFSFGLSSDDFNPDNIVSTMDWYANDTIDFNSLHIKSISDDLTQYGVTVSTTSPETGGAYTSSAQAKDVTGTAVHRIGITLTPSVIDGSGTISESTVTTDRYGASETIHNTAGGVGDTERTHVTDGVITANGPTVTPIASNRDLTITSLDNGGKAAGSTFVASIAITIPAGATLIIRLLDLHHNVPVLGDINGVELSSQPFSFHEDAYVHGSSGGDLSIYSSGVLASGFSGTVIFNAGGSAFVYALAKGVPNASCSVIRVIALNTATMHNEAGSVNVSTITYPQAFTNTHNIGVSAFANYSNQASTPKSGWTETDDLDQSGIGNPLRIACQHKLGGDTTASSTYPINPTLLWGAVCEYEALS